MAGVVCVRGLCAGAVSRPLCAADLLAHLPADNDQPTVFAELDCTGALCAVGGGGARLATHARLAPHDLCADAQLELEGGAKGTRLRLRVLRPVAPLSELRVWFSAEARAALQLPHLAPLHIRGKREYRCGECGAAFEQPNPLKAHLFLRCRGFAAAAFWRRVAGALAEARPAPAPLPWGPGARAPPAGGHPCLFCGKVYSRRYGLKIHVRTHTGHRPLRCRHCARAFGDPSNLNKHVRLHEGGRRRQTRRSL